MGWGEAAWRRCVLADLQYNTLRDITVQYNIMPANWRYTATIFSL
jgi:hypothetical protein